MNNLVKTVNRKKVALSIFAEQEKILKSVVEKVEWKRNHRKRYYLTEQYRKQTRDKNRNKRIAQGKVSRWSNLRLRELFNDIQTRRLSKRVCNRNSNAQKI